MAASEMEGTGTQFKCSYCAVNRLKRQQSIVVNKLLPQEREKDQREKKTEVVYDDKLKKVWNL